jgi:excisionase family DNA binding protein
MAHPERGQEDARVVRGWTTGYTAERTGLSVSTIRRMIDDGRLLGVQPAGWRYVDPEDGALLARENDTSLSVAERDAARVARRALHARKGHVL